MKRLRSSLLLYAAGLVTAVSAVATPLAEGAARCSNDNLTIDGQKIGAQFCVLSQSNEGPNKPIRVSLSESLSGAGGKITRTATLPFVAPEGARALDDIPLSSLGITKTLHATFVLSGGAVRLEHALLIPGVVTIR